MTDATKLAREALEKVETHLTEYCAAMGPEAKRSRQLLGDVREALAALSTAPGESALWAALNDLVDEVTKCDPLDLPPSLNLAAGRAFNLLASIPPTAPGESEKPAAWRYRYNGATYVVDNEAFARQGFDVTPLYEHPPAAPAGEGWQDIASLPDTDEMILAGRTSDGAQMVWRASILYRQVHGKTPAHLGFFPTHWKRLDRLPPALAQETSND